MKKYSKEWKEEKGRWTQKHDDDKWGVFYKIHYIENGTEYSTGEFINNEDAEKELENY